MIGLPEVPSEAGAPLHAKLSLMVPCADAKTTFSQVYFLISAYISCGSVIISKLLCLEAIECQHQQPGPVRDSLDVPMPVISPDFRHG